VRDARVSEGLLLVNALHTTCALFVNEYQAALNEDVKAALGELVPDHGGFKHDDPRYSDCERGNGAAHLRTALLSRSVLLGITGREVALGRFQSILLAEFDGPRTRDVDVRILGA
jgi:secondary thiamine-phosphate synthase enzyme